MSTVSVFRAHRPSVATFLGLWLKPTTRSPWLHWTLGSGIWEELTARDLSFGGRLPTPQFWEEGAPLPSFRALGCTSLGLDAFLVPLFCAHGILQAFPPGVQRRMVPHKNQTT